MRGEQACRVWCRLGGHAVRINRLPHYVSSTSIPSYAPPTHDAHATPHPPSALIEPQQPMAQTRPRRVSLKKFPGRGYECSACGASFSSLKNGGAHVAICGAPSAPSGATTPSSAASHVSDDGGERDRVRSDSTDGEHSTIRYSCGLMYCLACVRPTRSLLGGVVVNLSNLCQQLFEYLSGLQSLVGNKHPSGGAGRAGVGTILPHVGIRTRQGLITDAGISLAI